MNQYVITGHDYTDDGALERRMQVRPKHLEGTLQLRASGNYILGGAILDDDGRMVGSVMILQFETHGQLLAWQNQEPYIVNKIWENIDIKPFKVANAV
ncbi:hypothetical protein BDD43_5037 [Mucilaginibacter gracilis]|uniref:YCII-related domain-containing protein n=1 Tax=Mucilaginibacter gracilis TaxID=423350 RepID=A0A495J8R5_9SPHI|nr:YciI family protein [Mucilaginibacter gracilis]RKR84784.1 hypothetical protein BDD43_5037 [Mucilaginibacter gracilis]